MWCDFMRLKLTVKVAAGNLPLRLTPRSSTDKAVPKLSPVPWDGAD